MAHPHVMAARNGKPDRTILLYPLFIEASIYATDPYWSAVFQDLAYARTPYGVYVNSETHALSSFLKGRERVLPFAELTNPAELYAATYQYLHVYIGIASMRENTMYIPVEIKDWDSLKKKYIKEFLLNNFVIARQKEYKFSIQTMREFMSDLNQWFQYKILTKDDIDFDPTTCIVRSIRNIQYTVGGPPVFAIPET